MCGIVAVLSKKTGGLYHNDLSIFKQLLIADVFRGPDSTGVFAVNRWGNVRTAKAAASSPFYIGMKDGAALLSEAQSVGEIVVGHNRKATMGKVDDTNAHPFVEGNIVLVHNGTLTNHKNLADKTVDSHAICHSINEIGYKETLKKIEGAYALIWYNAQEQTLYFCRNAERPLHYVETHHMIYIASEAKMLDWILDRNNITKYKIELVPTDKVFKFDRKEKTLTSEYKPKKEKVLVLETRKEKKKGKLRPLPHVKAKTGTNQSSPSSSKTGSEENEEPCNYYETGERIPLQLYDFKYLASGIKLEGYTDDPLKTPFHIWIPDPDFDVNLIDEMISADNILGTITHVSYNTKTKETKLICTDPAIPRKATSQNGVVISEVDFIDHGECCSHCGTIMDFHQIKNMVVTLNADGDIAHTYCSDCQQDLRNWGVIH